MAMDEQVTRSDMEKLQDLLEHTAGKSKKQKGKTEEQCITFENLDQYPYVMRQSAWVLDWDKVQVLYCPCIGIPTFIINGSIIAQWSSTASPSSPQWWTDSEDSDTLYAHAVLLSLTLLNLLNTVEGRERGNYRNDPKLFVYSTVVILVHPGQVLTTIQNAVGFFQHQYDAILQGGHSNGWCTLCKLPRYKMSRYFPVVPHMLCLALPMSQPSGDPTVWPQLCLDSAGCDADHMIIRLLHYMRHHNTDYAMLPPALWSNLDVPWELHMEEYPKLWQNSVYTTWKAGSPGVEVGLAMTFVSMSHREFDSGWLVLDIADMAAIRYLVLRVDNVDDSDESTGEVVEDDDDEDDSNDEDVDEDLHKAVTEIATKTDDSSFCSNAEDNAWLEVISGPGTSWMGRVLSYSLKAPAVGSQSGMHMVSHSEEVMGSSFDAFLKECADGSGVGELIGGQALLWDYTTAAELKQLCKLANEQVSITRRFDTKFSNTAFALLQKIHKAFIGTGGITQKFIDDMVTIALNFIRDATTYEMELLALDGMAFAAEFACIWGQIADLIKEASALELMYEGAQKKFADILEWVEMEVKEYLDTQSTVDCMTFMDESFDSLRKFSDAFNVSPFVLVVVGMVITHHSLLTSLRVNVSHFPLKIFLLPLMSDTTLVSGQMALLSYVAWQSVTVQERQAQLKPIPRTGTGEMDPTLESNHGSNVGLNPQKPKLDQMGLMPSKKDQLEAQSSKTPTLPMLPQDPPWGDTPPPLPLPSPVKKHNTCKGQNAHPSSSVASLLAQFRQSQHSRSRDVSPKSMPTKDTPVKGVPAKDTPKKDTPKKGEQTPAKKLLMPDKST